MSKNTPIYIRVMIGLVLVIAFVSYIAFNSRIFIAGPKLNIVSPISGDSFDKSLIHIEGSTENTVFISINDRPILIDEMGNFKESLLLASGYNIIMIEARDKFDRTISKRLDLFYKTLEKI